MAPELRKRKAPAEGAKPNGTTTKTVAKTATKGKRKAVEDTSPVSAKKQKPVKKTPNDETSKQATTVKTAKTAKAKKPAKEPEQVEEESFLAASDGSSDSEDEAYDNAQALAAQVDPENEDSAANEALFKPGQDVGKAPKISKEARKSAESSNSEPGVVYIGRIPHGFYEYEMKQYFTQFGAIRRMRLSRNKKTGASKHFAFIEFEEASTAEIVAKTMDNYLLFGHLLKCKTIPKDDLHDSLFKGANRRFKKIPWNKMAGLQLDKPKSESEWASKVSKEKTRRNKQAAKLKAIGYDFDAPELSDIPAPAAIEAAETEVKAIEEAPEEKPAEETEAQTESISSPKPKGRSAKPTKAKKVKA